MTGMAYIPAINTAAGERLGEHNAAIGASHLQVG